MPLSEEFNLTAFEHFCRYSIVLCLCVSPDAKKYIIGLIAVVFVEYIYES